MTERATPRGAVRWGAAASLALVLLGAGCTTGPRAALARSTGPRGHAAGLAAGTGALVVVGDGTAGYSPDGTPAAEAALDAPGPIVLDGRGDLFVADTDNCRVREVPAATGVQFGRLVHRAKVVTVAGGPCGSPGDRIGFPSAVAVDAEGDLLVADGPDDRVFVLGASSGHRYGLDLRPGTLEGLAGTGAPGDAGIGGPATAAELDWPTGLAVGPDGEVYITDTGDCLLEAVEPAASDALAAGSIRVVAGTGTCGTAGDGGPATRAELWDPVSVAVDPRGDVFVGDRGASQVLEIAARDQVAYGVTERAGALTTVAGIGSYGTYVTDGLAATSPVAELTDPAALALDARGDLLVADPSSRCIRLVAASDGRVFGLQVTGGSLYTIAGALPSGPLFDGTRWVGPHMVDPEGLAVGAGGRVLYSDRGADTVFVLVGSA